MLAARVAQDDRRVGLGWLAGTPQEARRAGSLGRLHLSADLGERAQEES